MTRRTERAWPLISFSIAAALSTVMAFCPPPMWLRFALWWLLLRRMLQQWVLTDALYQKVRHRGAWHRQPLRFFREAGMVGDVFWQLRRAQEAAVFASAGLLLGAVFFVYTGRAWDWLAFISMSVYGSLAGIPANRLCKFLCEEPVHEQRPNR